ncbi:MAG: hypothetical protein ACYDEY_08585 [Acidimicrobiales bacterium]
MILLTTNDGVGRLHPAVTRPGRCLSVLEFPRFTPGEARLWLGEGIPPPDAPATLAELFERRDHRQLAGVATAPYMSGAYL